MGLVCAEKSQQAERMFKLCYPVSPSALGLDA